MVTETLTIPKELTPAERRARKIATEIGLSWETLSQNLKEKFVNMDKVGHLEASANMNSVATFILNDSHPELVALLAGRKNPEERDEIFQAITFADIGKVKDEFTTQVFGVHDTIPQDMVVGEFFTMYLPHLSASLGEHGIDPNKTMREAFFDRHTEEGVNELEKESAISKRVIVMIAAHHSLEGVKVKGYEEELSIEDKLIILLDKYDALRTRAGKTHREARKTHREAIVWLKDKIKEAGYGDDPEFRTLINVLNKVARRVRAYQEKPRPVTT